jgi:hypothetical protein
MAKSKKKATNQTTEDALKRLFPKPVIEELKRLAAESGTKKRAKSKQPKAG